MRNIQKYIFYKHSLKYKTLPQKKYKVLALSFVFLWLSSCNKYLDIVPDNRTEINTPEKISELLVSAYPASSYSAFCELMSDNVSENFTNSTLGPIYTKPFFWEDVLEIDTDSPLQYWGSCYAAIAAANQALESIEKLGGGANLNPQKGEALVARAYAHFMLVNLFSKFYDASTAASDPGIPYVTEPEKVVLKQYERKTVAFVYEQIEKDLLAGIPLISDRVYKVPAYHFTKNAAYAFASRYYLYKRDYDKVIEYSSKVAGEGGFAPNMRDWTNDLSNKGFNVISNEYGQATQKSNLLLIENTSFWGRYWANQRFGLNVNVGQELYFAPQPGGGNLSYTLFGGDRGVFLPKYNELFVRVNPSANIGLGYVMMPAFTTEEVLFNRAEAYLYKGNIPGCLADLNTFISLRIENYNAANHTLTVAKNNAYYGTNNTNQALLETLMYYRRLEFMHEGLRWFDNLRYNMPVTHESVTGSSITLEPGSPKRLLQLPQEAVLSGLKPNPR